MHLVTLPNNDAKFPDRISACAPRGLREQVRRAAEAEQITPPEFIRRAVERHVAEVLSVSGQPTRSEPLDDHRR